MPQKTSGGTQVCLPDEHIHTLLGYNVALVQPSSAAKPESNILRSPHVAQGWPRPQMEIIHHCNSVQTSVCSLSVCHVCPFGFRLRLFAFLFISLSVLVLLPGYESLRLSACLLCAPLVFIRLCLSVCLSADVSHQMHALSGCPLPFSQPCLLVCVSVPATVIKRNICSGSSRQQH